MKHIITLPLCALVVPLIPAASADEVFSDDVVIIDDGLCLGPDCVDGETFGPVTVGGPTTAYFKLKGFETLIHFDDTSTTALAPKRDWQLSANDASANLEAFMIQDLTSGTTPFMVEGQAPTHAMVVHDDGFVGLGTQIPVEPLHLVQDSSPTIRLEQSTSGGEEKAIWDIVGNNSGFILRDNTEFTFKLPFYVQTGTPSGTLLLADNGYVSMGKTSGLPDAPLELYQSETFNFFRITAASASVNQSVDITFTEGPLGTGQLRYNIVDGDNQEMSLDADGNMVLDGTLTTAGPTCAGGCDRVFDVDYALPSIAEHQAAAWSAGHLPNIGPTLPEQTINLSEKMGGVINELEHAHIFIGQQQAEIAAQRALIAQQTQAMEQVLNRLATLEAQVADQP